MRTLIFRSLAASLAVLLLAVFLYGCSGGAEPDPSMANSSTEESFDATVALKDAFTCYLPATGATEMEDEEQE